MQARIRLFALYREQVGADQVDLTLPEGATVAQAVAELLAAHRSLPRGFRPHLIAVNEEFASMDHPLSDGDEVALYPPVSGGTDASITHSPIDVRALAETVRRPHNGAVVTFEGVVRNQTHGREVLYLEYEAHEPVAEKVLARVLEEATRRFDVDTLAARHRLGRLETGEVSLAVAVGSPHRREAFLAIQYVVDRIKQTVPIWKKEFFHDGSVWVGLASDHEQEHEREEEERRAPAPPPLPSSSHPAGRHRR